MRALPTHPERLRYVGDLQHEAVELLAMRIRAYRDAYYDRDAHADPMPTYADIGALWSFVDGLRADVEHLTDHTNEIGGALPQLDSMRMDGDRFTALANEEGDGDV